MKLNKSYIFDKLIKTIETYIHDAESCGEKELYFAACVMFGAALEACLYCFFLSQVEEHEIPSSMNKLKVNLFDLIEECHSNDVFCSSQKLKSVDPHEIRKLRNFIHPLKLASTGKDIDKNSYLKIRDNFYLAKEHLFYWLTGDHDIEDE